MENSSVHDSLIFHGYKLVEDAWDEFGRRTYVHDDDASRDYLGSLLRALRPDGWTKSQTELRAFAQTETGDVLEIEPGGSETSGHFAHHFRAFTITSAAASR